jgi:DNA mismatch endonuclease (patch repair protein)
MDKISPEARSKNMSLIKSKNTKPELVLREELCKRHLRYRIQYKIRGKPDIVFPKKKIAIFVNGCFWHGHGCAYDHEPKTNTSFWSSKIRNNKIRDKKNQIELSKIGWKVLVIWECNIEENLNKILQIVQMTACRS